jgi:heptosyltransferase II
VKRPPIRPKKILVIREGAIGDVLCMTPFLKQLRLTYPEAQIDYVVIDWVKDVLKHNPNIDTLFVTQADGLDGKRWSFLWKRLLLLFPLMFKRYNLVFCPSTQLKNKLQLLLFPFAYKVGFAVEPKSIKSINTIMFDDYIFIDVLESPKTKHIAIRNLEMLDLLVGEKKGRDQRLELFTSDTEKDNVKTIFTKYQLDSQHQIIAIAASAGGAIKNDAFIKTAPAEKFKGIISLLQHHNPDRRFVFLGSKSEHAYVEAMNVCDGKIYVNLCGKLSLSESAELLKHCALLISNDSGATHLASALQMNHIVFFGATDEIEFGPYLNPKATILRFPLPCAPCYQDKCTVPDEPQFQGHVRPYCLSLLNVHDIVDLAESKLRDERKSIS